MRFPITRVIALVGIYIHMYCFFLSVIGLRTVTEIMCERITPGNEEYIRSAISNKQICIDRVDVCVDNLSSCTRIICINLQKLLYLYSGQQQQVMCNIITLGYILIKTKSHAEGNTQYECYTKSNFCVYLVAAHVQVSVNCKY